MNQRVQKLIQERLENGRYETTDDVLLAALAALEQQEDHGDFAPGELDALLAEGECPADARPVRNAVDVLREVRGSHGPTDGGPE